jgi:hypothetical protein
VTRSKAVIRLGKEWCELCGKNGTEDNPLTVHHCSGNREDNATTNQMAVHRWRCHTFADAVTQEYMYRGGPKATWANIKRAYRHFIPIV